MKIYEIKTKDGIINIPVSYLAKESNGTLTYFKRGNGYVKTKSFKVLPDVELPDKWDELSWLEICKIHELYGIEVSNSFAECKVAGIISRQTILGRYAIYSKIKDIIPANFDSFFELLTCNYLLSCFGMYTFDICTLDTTLAKIDKDYNDTESTYKGETISMANYITLKYGAEYSTIIKKLIDTDLDKEKCSIEHLK